MHFSCTHSSHIACYFEICVLCGLADTASASPCSTWLLITFLFQHQLCIGEIFQGLDVLKNQTVRGGTVETLFQNLSLIKKYIDRQKVSFPGSLRVRRHLLPQQLMTVCSSVLFTGAVWRGEAENTAVPGLPAGVSWCAEYRVDNGRLTLSWLREDRTSDLICS